MTVFILADHCNLRSGIVQLTRGDWLTASGDISCKGGNKILKYFVIIFLILGDYTWNRGLNCQLLHVQTPVYNSLIIDCSQGTIQRAFSDVLLLYSAKFCWHIYYSLLSSEHIVGVMWWHFSSQTECCWAVLKWEIRSHSLDPTLRAATDTITVVTEQVLTLLSSCYVKCNYLCPPWPPVTGHTDNS